MQKINCLSDVDLKMSQVNVLLSEINQEMSSSLLPVQSSFLLLPRVQIILSEINKFVQTTQQLRDQDAGVSSFSPSDVDDECFHDTRSLEWDNDYNYYSLYYYNRYLRTAG